MTLKAFLDDKFDIIHCLLFILKLGAKLWLLTDHCTFCMGALTDGFSTLKRISKKGINMTIPC